MTTGSSSARPSEYVIAPDDDLPDILDEQCPAPEPAPPVAATAAHGDPVGELVRAAVADRPLEDVADLITTLERSPEHARATVDALRAVGLNRSVEDVTRLAGLLTRPPRSPDSADEAIRAAAACRSVEEVSRLMELLHRTPLEPHCGQEAVRAAATGRPVEDLVRLIGRLAESGRAHPDRPAAALAPLPEETGEARAPKRARRWSRFTAVPGAGIRARRERRRDPRPARDRAGRHPARGPVWPTWLTVAALAGCGVAYFPLHQNGASPRDYGLALGLSALCLVLALLLTVRPAVPMLAAAVVGPAALAMAKQYGSAAPSARVSPAVELTLAPTWIAVPVAVCASLVALTALCVRGARQAPDRPWPARPIARASRAAE
ncbi:hypothetical protein AB0L35_05925 [Streptomyces sp. NPDC052309]|uniref:hypothetical protein n=1 Tax=Streptomyces sp. NPDC052309 TaxID=3155421 RepID=UPI003444E05B